MSQNYHSVISDAFDFDLLVDTLQKLKEGKHVDVPVYDFATHSRAKYTVSIDNALRYQNWLV